MARIENGYFFKPLGRHPLGGAAGHTVCVLKNNKALYITGDTNATEMTDRFFSSYKEVADSIAKWHSVPLEDYATGFEAFVVLRK